MRPGCLQNGMLDNYITCKENNKPFDYNLGDSNLTLKVQEICKECYSIMTYQEYVIRCFSDIAGFNEIESDNSRRALGKKSAKLLESLKTAFIEGGMKNGYTESALGKLFDIIEQYSAYSFNASHSMAYSYISAQCAYLSANYPLEFYASALTVDSENQDDVRKYIYSAKERGIEILPPRINSSSNGFVIYNDKIIFGLDAIKGVGTKVTNIILNNRPHLGYSTFGDFVYHNSSVINKKILEAYIKAGLFTDLGTCKHDLLASVEVVLEFVSSIKQCTTYTIFDIVEDETVGKFIDNCLIRKTNTPDDPYYEIESIGLYITEHPMSKYKPITNKSQSIDEILTGDYSSVIVPGALTNISIRKTNKKVNMAECLLTDECSAVKIIFFPKVYSQVYEQLKEGKLFLIFGHMKHDEEEPVILVQKIQEITGYSQYVGRKEVVYNKGVNSVVSNRKIIKISNSLSFVLEKCT